MKIKVKKILRIRILRSEESSREKVHRKRGGEKERERGRREKEEIGKIVDKNKRERKKRG